MNVIDELLFSIFVNIIYQFTGTSLYFNAFYNIVACKRTGKSHVDKNISDRKTKLNVRIQKIYELTTNKG